eukprot:768475-Hanusia_phi.AAC.13
MASPPACVISPHESSNSSAFTHLVQQSGKLVAMIAVYEGEEEAQDATNTSHVDLDVQLVSLKLQQDDHMTVQSAELRDEANLLETSFDRPSYP